MIKSHQPNAPDQSFLAGLKLAMMQHKDMPVDRMLAITSVFVGQLIAIQNQNKYTADQLIQIVIENIQVGNRDVIREVMGTPQGSA